MYCAGCGNAINTQLNYCNTCGMRLSGDETSEFSSRVLVWLVITFGVIAVFGLGALIALVGLLLDRGMPEKNVTILAVFYLAALAAIEFALGDQIKKLIEAGVRKNKKPAPQIVQPAQFAAPNTAQLPEPSEMPASVTDNTTRIFDKVPLSVKKKTTAEIIEN